MLISEASLDDVEMMRNEVIKCRDEALGVNMNPERAVCLSHLAQFLWDVIEQNKPQPVCETKNSPASEKADE